MLTTYGNDYAMLKTMVMRGYFVLSFKKMDEDTSKNGGLSILTMGGSFKTKFFIDNFFSFSLVPFVDFSRISSGHRRKS